MFPTFTNNIKLIYIKRMMIINSQYFFLKNIVPLSCISWSALVNTNISPTYLRCYYDMLDSFLNQKREYVMCRWKGKLMLLLGAAAKLLQPQLSLPPPRRRAATAAAAATATDCT